MYKCNSSYMTNTTITSNLQTEDYINGYLQIESQLKDKMYFGEMNSFKKQLQNIEWDQLSNH